MNTMTNEVELSKRSETELNDMSFAVIQKTLAAELVTAYLEGCHSNNLDVLTSFDDYKLMEYINICDHVPTRKFLANEVVEMIHQLVTRGIHSKVHRVSVGENDEYILLDESGNPL